MAKSKTEQKTEKPLWLKYTEEEVKAIIHKLSNQGLTAEKIGLYLRDQYGIPTIKLYGIKIKDVLEEITKRARAANTANIYSIWSDIEKPGKTNIPENSLDVIFLINILWHFSNFDNALNEAKRLLKKKARILIVDWKKSGLPIGPKEKDIIDFNKITRWALNNNFAVQEHFEISDYNQGLVLYRNE